jgi:DNA-binding LacI/PurR family transcriptional regulator
MKTTVNSIDVARLAGVSQSAVSRVFTPGSSVSPAMREKVLRAAAALGYQPNRLAGSLITHRSHLIGIAIGYLGNYYYPLAVECLCRRLRRSGYHTMMFFTEPKEAADDTVESFLQYRVDGVILASVSLSSDWVTACERSGVPVILFNRFQKDPRVSTVSVDNLQGASSVAEFLVKGGHRRIAYIAGLEGTSAQDEREVGFRKTLAAFGMPLFDRTVGAFETEPARQAARLLFDRPAAERPDAVFACSDQMALAVMDVIRFELGLRVPEDVSVVGFDDVPQAAWPAYDLTTMRQSIPDMIEATMAALLERIERPTAEPRRIHLPVSLITRGSSRLPPGWTKHVAAAGPVPRDIGGTVRATRPVA